MDPIALAAEQKKLEELGAKVIAEAKKEALARDTALIETLTKEFDARLKGFMEAIAKAVPSASLPGVNVDATGKKKDAFCLARASHATFTGDFRSAGYEAEVFKAMEDTDWRQKAMSVGIDTAGGHLAPTEVSSKILDKLLPASIAMRLGVPIQQVSNVAAMTFTRETQTALAQWVGEMVTATKRDLKWSTFTIRPKALSAKADISNLLQLLAAGLDTAETRYVNSSRRQFGLALDKAVFIGASSDQGPVGVGNTEGRQVSTGAALTYDKLVDFETKMLQANLPTTKFGWAGSVTKFDEIRKLKDSTGQPLLYRDVTAAGVQRVLGHELLTSTQLGTTGANTLILGAWDLVTIYQWFGGLMVQKTNASDQAMDNDVTRIALRMYADIGVDYPEAFVCSSD